MEDMNDAEPGAGIIRVATFNIRHGRGLDERVDLARTAAALADTGAVLFGLQEIDQGWERSGGEDQAARIAAETGMTVEFRPTFVRAGAAYGLALAAHSELEDVRIHMLSSAPGHEPRGALTARWRGVIVVVTHLSRHRRERRVQVAELASLVRSRVGPVVLMGDFNQGRWGLGPLRRAGLSGPRVRRPTSPAKAPYRQIDLIVAGKGARVVRSWARRSDASDHLPLVAEIELPPRNGGER